MVAAIDGIRLIAQAYKFFNVGKSTVFIVDLKFISMAAY